MTITTKDFPDKEFATKEELFEVLRTNVKSLIAVKKAEIHKSATCSGFLLKEQSANKGMNMQDGYVYPIINTTKYMDSHRDVHFDGLWNKSAKEQNGKLFYVTDHEVKVDHVIAWPTDVNVLVKSVPWAFVGKDFDGETEALIFEILKDKIVHDKAKRIIEERRPVQNSVRMQYVKLFLGMDSDDKDDIEYKKYYDRRIKEIANKEEVEALGYFWGVEEAKIVTEGSMVIKGSNDATPINQKQLTTDSTTNEPLKSTHEQPPFDLLEAIKETKFF